MISKMIKIVKCYYEGENPMIQYFDGFTYRACYLNHDGHCPLSHEQINHYLTQLEIWSPVRNDNKIKQLSIKC